MKKRFSSEYKNDNINITIIKVWEYDDGWDAFMIEQKVLSLTKELFIDTKDIKDGRTEIRKEDILDVIEKVIHKYNVSKIKDKK